MIAFAGSGMNILLAVVILTGLFMICYPKIPSTLSPEVGYVVADSAAAKAGIREGDRIVQIGDVANPTWEDIAMKEVASAGHELPVWVMRDGERKKIMVTPVLDARSGVGFAGLADQDDIEVASALPDKPGGKDGLQFGDIIVKVNGQPIHSTQKILDIIAKGQPLQIDYLSNGKPQTTTLTPINSPITLT